MSILKCNPAYWLSLGKSDDWKIGVIITDKPLRANGSLPAGGKVLRFISEPEMTDEMRQILNEKSTSK